MTFMLLIVFFALQICRPSMRKVAAALASSNPHTRSLVTGNRPLQGDSSDGNCTSETNSSIMCGSAMYSSTSAAGAVGNAIIGSESLGVSSITFEQHSSMVRYPNSMSNLRRLRCYLLAAQVTPT